MRNFYSEHLADLKNSGLSDEMIEAMAVYSARPADISKLIGWDPPQVESVLVFPYFRDGARNGFSRVRLFPVTADKNGHKIKYLQKSGTASHIYVLPSAQHGVSDVSRRLFITEGEKKAAKANQEGLLTLGIPGLWNWLEKGTANAIEEFDRIPWRGREVFIVPDSDVWSPNTEKKKRINLQRAVYALGKEIETRGSSVGAIILPQEDDKVGLDDYLVRRSREELESLPRITLKDAPLKHHSGWWRRWIDKKENGEQIATIGFNLTDLGNAERLVALHREDLRYCPQLGWLVWDGRRWCADESGEVKRRAKLTVRAIYRDASDCEEKEQRERIAKWAHQSEAAGRIDAMVEMAKTEPGIFIAQTDLDCDPWLLNVLNGTLDLKTTELRKHRREDFITKLIEVEYSPHVTCSLWEKFIARITGSGLDPWNDPNELARFIQKAVGYSLTADISEQCMFFLYGTGQNGKSTFLNTIRSLLGDYALHTPTDTLLMKRGDQIPNDVARLAGARFVSAVEADAGRRLAEGLIKQLTGGDRITARFMRRDFFEFDPTFKLWLSVNHKPRIRGTDTAIWRRIRLIPFSVTIPENERISDMGAKLKAEFPGILVWAVQGAKMWLKEGLKPPDSVDKATADYRKESDTIGQFIDECCELGEHETVTKADLYKRFSEWAEESGEQVPRKNEFGACIAERGFNDDQRGTHRTRVWVGIGVKVNTANAPER